MIAFPSTAMTRDPATLKDAARKAPVAITEHNRAKFVLMSMEDFVALSVARLPGLETDPRRSHATAGLPADVKALVLEALEQPYGA